MNHVRQWIRKFPEPERRAITDASQSVSLAKIRRGSRMFEELAHDEGGPSLNVELLSTYNLEPASAAMQFALNCIPGQAYLHLAPLDAIGAIVAAIEGPWLEAEYPPPLRGKKTNGDEQSRFIPSSTPRLFQSAGGNVFLADYPGGDRAVGLAGHGAAIAPPIGRLAR